MSTEAEYSHDQLDRELTPKMGAHRKKEDHKNPLLVQPQLGCVKQTVYDLPSKGNLQHEYGLRQERDGTSSAEVVGNWAQSEPNPNVVPGRDFKMLNKHAVTEGVTSCKGIAGYRSTHDFRLKLGSEKAADKKPYDASTAFGRPTQSSESFNDLVSHSYRYEWHATAPDPATFLAAKAPKKPTMTKSAIALAAAAQAKLSDAPSPPLWKMKAFNDTPAKIGQTG